MATVVGVLFESWTMSWITLVVLVTMAFHDGGIRLSGRRQVMGIEGANRRRLLRRGGAG